MFFSKTDAFKIKNLKNYENYFFDNSIVLFSFTYSASHGTKYVIEKCKEKMFKLKLLLNSKNPVFPLIEIQGFAFY